MNINLKDIQELSYLKNSKSVKIIPRKIYNDFLKLYVSQYEEDIQLYLPIIKSSFYEKYIEENINSTINLDEVEKVYVFLDTEKEKYGIIGLEKGDKIMWVEDYGD